MSIEQTQRQERRMKSEPVTIEQLEQVIQAALSPINLQLQNGEKRMDGFARDIGELALKQDLNNAVTTEMHQVFDTAKKGLVLLGAIGGGLKWVAGIVAAVAATWAVMKGKGPTP